MKIGPSVQPYKAARAPGDARAPVEKPRPAIWTRPTIVKDVITTSSREFQWEAPSYQARGLEFAQITGEVAANYAKGTLQAGLGAFNGVVAVGTLYAGVHDLVNARTNLDRLGGIASLALASDVALTSISHATTAVPGLPAVSHGLGLIYGASDLILGSYDFSLGLREKDKNYAAAGLFQAAMGAGALTALAIPRFGPIGDAIMLISLAGRHFSFQRELMGQKAPDTEGPQRKP